MRLSVRLLVLLTVAACTGPDDDTDTTDTDVDTDDTDVEGIPQRYEFASRTGEGSSVAYDGQVFRHLLINDLKSHLGGVTTRVDNGWFPVSGEVSDELEFYFAFDGDTSGSVAHLFASDPAAVQATYDDVSSGKDLVGKIAGNDAGGHEDWATDFEGWEQEGVTTPESLVRVWFAEIDAAAVAWSNGDFALGPSGEPVPAIHVSADGRDRRELLQKFLLGAVAFSQGADDYLDDDIVGSGLLSTHVPESGKKYSPLEHGWDEGFGYFGAARDYPAWTDELIASPSTSDTFAPDGAIDLLSEVTWGHAQNSAKRDLGAVVATDLTADAWAGFAGGRQLLAGVEGELTPAQLDELRGFRDQAVGAWEAAIAATVVHYVNDVLQDMSAFGTDDYSFGDHAKHWSELKGFALSFQFNPRSPLTDDEFATLHALLGTAPVLPGADSEAVADYRADLIAARELVGTAYGFDAANLGDADGENGW